ncbi:MAG: hypothetical protein R2726_07040 [Acidimicrobiales bacterium]
MSSPEQECLSGALQRTPELFGTDAVVLLQNAPALAALLAGIQGCASAERLANGLSRLLPFFVGDQVPKDQRTCLATTMAGLSADDLLAVLRVFYDVSAAAGAAQVAQAQALVGDCGVDLAPSSVPDAASRGPWGSPVVRRDQSGRSASQCSPAANSSRSCCSTSALPSSPACRR